MTGARIAISLAIAVACAVAAVTIAPRGFHAGALLAAEDDPTAIADSVVARSFDAVAAQREIDAALVANDADLAQSFVALARDQNLPLDPAQVARVDAANAVAATAARNAGSFARGLATGEPDDLAGLAGTAVGDLLVFGDIRDAVREGTRLATGQQADELVLGLSCVGLAITAGTYVTLGSSAPIRVGLTVVKAARKTGRLGVRMSAWVGRSLREMVDVAALRRALANAKVEEPLIAMRAARAAVKLDKGDDLLRVVGDVGRVQAKAGTQAALDGLKLAEGPRDVSRIARLATSKGNKTRAILKIGGRAAIALTLGGLDLVWWVIGAIFTAFGFVSSMKGTVERATQRHLHLKKLRRARIVTYSQA